MASRTRPRRPCVSGLTAGAGIGEVVGEAGRVHVDGDPGVDRPAALPRRPVGRTQSATITPRATPSSCTSSWASANRSRSGRVTAATASGSCSAHESGAGSSVGQVVDPGGRVPPGERGERVRVRGHRVGLGAGQPHPAGDVQPDPGGHHPTLQHNPRRLGIAPDIELPRHVRSPG